MLVATNRALKFLWLEITKRCNLTCLHCYANSNPQQELFGRMTIADWKAVISEACDLGCGGIQFIGGEPTLHPNLMELIMYAQTSGVGFVEVFTNATGISDHIATDFKTNRVNIACSFYSADAAVHDSITQRKGSFVQTVNGIKKLLAYGIPLRVELIEMKENAGHAGTARTFLNNLGVKRGGEDRQRAIGRGDRIGLAHSQINELCGKCSDGRLCVTASGDVYPCVFSRFCLLGDVRTGLASLLNSPQLLDFCEKHQSRAAARSLGRASVLGEDCSPYRDCRPDDECNPECSPECGCSPEEGCGPDE